MVIKTKNDVHVALVERKRLKRLREKELNYQFQRASDMAHNSRMSESTVSWDVPTDMEIIAETKEDIDCRGGGCPWTPAHYFVNRDHLQ